MTKAKFIKMIIALLIAVAVYFLPYEAFGVVINPVEKRIISIFAMAALFWILEPIPIWSTSVLVIVVMLLSVSTSSILPFQTDASGETFKNLIKYKEIMATFADPTIMLFLGGFFLAEAATKYRLDMNLARVFLKPFGKQPKYLLLGIMIITSIFSMFMSNTATTAMMLAILAPVIALFSDDDVGAKAAFALSIPLAANIGGMGTPIGTPPNAIALKAMNEQGLNVSFGKWMAFGVPYVIILIIIAWFLLTKIFTIKAQSMELKVGDKFMKTPKAITVYVTFAVTVILWVLGDTIHGLDSNTIAMIPMAVFTVTGIITKKDLKAMEWDVLWLVAGGFALGVGLQKTGLAADLINSIPFASWPAFGLMIGVGIICLFMANFMSHTSTASLMVPLIAAVGVAVGGNLDPMGGVTALLVSVAFASSLGMSLPISTPPNALAYATGYVDTKGMAKVGVTIGVLGMILTYAMMYLLAQCHFFVTADAAKAAIKPKAAVVETVPAAPSANAPTTVTVPATAVAK